MSTHVQWLAPPPLWQELSSAPDPTQFRSPAILRFATDTFMQDLQGVLKTSPQDLRNYVAQGETWRDPASGINATGNALPLKLYQPTHQRFYLVASSLTCRMPGLPDHTVSRTASESVAFVVRQLRPKVGYSAADCAVYDPAKCSEYAWIPPAAGASASGTQPGWMQTASSDVVLGEEQIPLSLTRTGSNGTSRRIFIGLIPAARRQQYIGAPTLGANADIGGSNANGTPSDPRMDLFYREVVGPWLNLEDWWTALGPSPDPENEPMSQLSSALILYDFAIFLNTNLASVWAAIQDTSKVSALTSAEGQVYTTLGTHLRTALVNANQYGPQFEALGPKNDIPPGYAPYALTDAANLIDPRTLQAPITNALPPLSSVTVPVLPPVPQKPSNPQGDFWFIVRCIYLRPKCGSNIVSLPCQPFQLANYFDSDAPARRIQVALPIDTSAASLRKYDKGVAFMISDELRNQMARVASLKDLSNGTIGNAGIDIGFICSFSIPIITICAMILLLVIVIALNLVFFWIPFFKICLPVPGLKGKN